MKSRPIIKTNLNNSEKIIEIIIWLILLFLWIYTIINYTSLPHTIPIHFNSLGKADGWGSKAILLINPIIASVLTVLMSLVSKFPHQFNYPSKITKENATKQYRLAITLIRYLKLIVVLIFSYITVSTINIAHSKNVGIGIWFLPLSVGVIFTLTLTFIIQSKKKNIVNQ